MTSYLHQFKAFCLLPGIVQEIKRDLSGPDGKKFMKSPLILALCLIGISGSALQAQADYFLVKPYLQNGTKTSMHILWETTATATTTVEYGEALPQAEEPNLQQKVILEGTRSLHEVGLTGLEPSTKYLYRVRSTTAGGQELVSEVYTFKTTVEDEETFTFALIGDSQYNSRTPWAWGKIAERVWMDRPNFVVHAGDLVDVGTRKEDWVSHFFPFGHVLMSRFPMYTVLGNHEQDAQLYYDYMVNPAPEYYYTFTYGNAQFFMIDTNRDVSEGSEQYDWLEWALAQSTARWKFVVHHHPPYSSEENDHGDSYIGASSYGTHARNLVPLYEAYGVDFCLFGHTHVYERTWPLLKDQVNMENGVVYINSGGAGGGLEDFDPVRSWFTQSLRQDHHYCTFSIFGDYLNFKAIDHEGRLFDAFQLHKNELNQTQVQQPPAPRIQISKPVFEQESVVRLRGMKETYEIFYTLDGSEPSRQSSRYSEPFTVTESSTLVVKCFDENGHASRSVQRQITKMKPQTAIKPRGRTERGLQYRYYEGGWEYLPDFASLPVIKSGVVATVDIEAIPHRENNFGVLLEGYLEVPETDTYTLYTYSDDGSKLYINDQLLVDSDGNHSAKYVYGTTILEKGKHRIKIEYFEGSGNNFVYAGFVRANNERVPFTPFELSHAPQD